MTNQTHQLPPKEKVGKSAKLKIEYFALTLQTFQKAQMTVKGLVLEPALPCNCTFHVLPGTSVLHAILRSS